MIPKDEPSRSEGVEYAPGEEWRPTTNSSRKNEATGPEQRWHLVVDVLGDRKVLHRNLKC